MRTRIGVSALAGKEGWSVPVMVAWGIVLLAAAILLAVMEVFLPSGLMTVVALIVGIGGIVCLFQENAAWGWIGILTVVVAIPMVLVFAIKLVPSTPLGRRMLFGESGKHEPVIPEERGTELEPLLGAEGEAITDLRPVGAARIEGQRIDVLSEVGVVSRGTRVRVTGIEGSQVRVRPVE